MGRDEVRRTRSKPPPLWWFVVYGILGGLIATGAAILFGRAVYGSWDPTSHALPIVILVVLVLAGCLAANRVVSWLGAQVDEARGKVEARRGLSGN